MSKDRVAWYSQMAARHPAMQRDAQAKALHRLMRNMIRLQCWHEQSWNDYLLDCRHALRACLSGTTAIWQSEQDSIAWWLEHTARDARRIPGLKRRRQQVKRLRDRILLHNQRMVIRLAHKKRPIGMEHSDLIMEGNLGLIRAVDLFDPRKNYRFSTYAHFWIDQAISLAMKQKSHTVRTPLSALNRAWQEQRDAQSAVREAGDYDTVIPALYPAQREAFSLDDPENGESLALEDHRSERPSLQIDAKRLVNQLTRELPERLSQVIALRYGINQRDAVGYREIADQLGVSRERARQLEQEALKQLKRVEDDPLKDQPN